MSGNLMAIIKQIAVVKQLDQDKVAEIIEDSLYQSISKKLLEENELKIVADFASNSITANFYKVVVENDFRLGEISLEEARKKYDPAIELGEKVYVKIPIHDFEPKVIKNARKSIQERIKKLEEDRIIFDYEKQKNQIVTGKVRRIESNGYIVELGYADALLPLEEQVEDEFYKVGDIIKGYVINIRKRRNDVIIILSRTTPEFVKKIFENEIPEIFSGDIVIKRIVREPGIRTKIAVQSVSEGIDAAGSCLGPKGIRIEQIKKELHGEQIDVTVWDSLPEQFIANAIGNDLVERVYVADRGNFARVIVSNESKNLAIGKKGKNVKLAAKLTGYKLDIFTSEEFEVKISEERRITSHIKYLDGVTEKISEILKEYGYTSVQDIFEASLEELTNLDGIGEKTALKLKESAKHF